VLWNQVNGDLIDYLLWPLTVWIYIHDNRNVGFLSCQIVFLMFFNGFSYACDTFENHASMFRILLNIIPGEMVLVDSFICVHFFNLRINS